MSPINRKYDLYLNDILTSMLRIEEYTENKEFIEFKQNYLVVDAVVRNFGIIGEASKMIPADIQLQYPEVPWKKMYSLRNLISYEYFGLEYEMIWEIAKNNLPQNIADISKIIKSDKSTNR